MNFKFHKAGTYLAFTHTEALTISSVLSKSRFLKSLSPKDPLSLLCFLSHPLFSFSVTVIFENPINPICGILLELKLENTFINCVKLTHREKTRKRPQLFQLYLFLRKNEHEVTRHLFLPLRLTVHIMLYLT